MISDVEERVLHDTAPNSDQEEDAEAQVCAYFLNKVWLAMVVQLTGTSFCNPKQIKER